MTGPVFTVCAALSACTPTGQLTSDIHELANIRPSNIVPKSSPKQLAGTFERFCLDGPRSAGRMESALRAADYVPVPLRNRSIRAFVVDDKRPMVAISVSGRICTVEAESRTGQTERLRKLVADRFPNAIHYDAGELARLNLEQAWYIPSVGKLTLKRNSSPSTPSSLIFTIWRRT